MLSSTKDSTIRSNWFFYCTRKGILRSELRIIIDLFKNKNYIMKLSICVAFILTCVSFKSQAQLEEKTWLIGGMGNFSFGKSLSDETLHTKNTSISIKPNIGYFFIPKLAAGVRAELDWTKNSRLDAQQISKRREFSFGPFVRYYLLKEENPINLLVDASYQYSVIKIGAVSNANESEISYYTTKKNKFEVSAGPVFYLNSVVGLETLISYGSVTNNEFSGHNYSLRFSIGLQIHLQPL